MSKTKKMSNRIWSGILAILALLYVYPVVMIFYNSLKQETAITTDGAFQLPTAQTFAGLAKFANISVVFGTFVYLAGVAVLWLTVGINLVSLCLLTSLTEGSILAFRLVVIVKNRRLMGAGPETIGKQK